MKTFVLWFLLGLSAFAQQAITLSFSANDSSKIQGNLTITATLVSGNQYLASSLSGTMSLWGSTTPQLSLLPTGAENSYGTSLTNDNSLSAVAPYLTNRGLAFHADVNYDLSWNGSQYILCWDGPAGACTYDHGVSVSVSSPSSLISLTANPLSAPAGTLITFTVICPACGPAFIMEFGDNLWSVNTQPTFGHTYANAGTYTPVVYGVLNDGSTTVVTATASPTIAHSVLLHWNSMTGVLGYNLYRGTADGGPYLPLQSSILSPTFLDTKAAPGETLYYVVRAYDSFGESGNSNQAKAMIP